MARHAANPTVKRLQDLIENNLASLQGFLLHQLGSEQEARAWLRQRYPNLGSRTPEAALNWLRQGEAAARTLGAGQQQPTARQIPVDPTIPRNRGYRYVLRIDFEEPNPLLRGRPGFDRSFSTHQVYYTNELLTARQLQSQVPSDIRERMQRQEARNRRGYITPEGFGQFRGTVTVEFLTRRVPGND